jgi:hypothetical protein
VAAHPEPTDPKLSEPDKPEDGDQAAADDRQAAHLANLLAAVACGDLIAAGDELTELLDDH